MRKMAVEKNYKIHILDISDVVTYFEGKIEHLLIDYMISYNEVNQLFDYCVHKAIAIVLNSPLFLNGAQIASNYLDKDLYDDTFAFHLGETFINLLYVKLKYYNIGNYSKIMKAHNRISIVKQNKPIFKIQVVGNALWIFEGGSSG